MKTFFALLVCSAFAQGLVSAQNYSIDWYKIAGGGGTSSGGNFSLVGTIGQHDAGTMTGGNYTLEGGFLSGLVLIQTPGSPLLSIQYAGGNATISWAADASIGFTLQEATSLTTPTSWGLSGATVNTDGNTKSVTVSALGMKYFRLIKP